MRLFKTYKGIEFMCMCISGTGPIFPKDLDCYHKQVGSRDPDFSDPRHVIVSCQSHTITIVGMGGTFKVVTRRNVIL